MFPGDTLLIVSNVDGNPGDYRVTKTLLNEEGLASVCEQGIFSRKDYKGLALGAVLNANWDRPYILDWEGGIGLGGNYYLGQIDELNLCRFKLNREENYRGEMVGRYRWRNYIWRTYPDVWIGWMTFTKYDGGGYCLSIPDPIDSSSTHILRFDKDGVPLEPSSLAEGGTRSARSFDRLPEGVKPYVDMKIWGIKGHSLVPDSGLVVFWGCDEGGNLYTYRKVNKY